MRQNCKGFAAHLHLLYFVSFPMYDCAHANLSLREVSHFATVNRLDSLLQCKPSAHTACLARVLRTMPMRVRGSWPRLAL